MPLFDERIDLDAPLSPDCPETAPEASRYFQRALDRHYARRRPLRVLELSSRAAPCLLKWISERPNAEVFLHCLKPDAQSATAPAPDRAFRDRVTVISTPLVKFKPAENYDLIWACGVFDGLKDSLFRARLRRLIPALAPGGELIAGNLSDDGGGSQARRRTAEALIRQALGCGLPRGVINVCAEPSGAFLFLHVVKPG